MKPYDYLKSYEENYDNGPFFELTEEARLKLSEMPSLPKKDLLGFSLNSTVGIAAGPLLNSNWIKFYAEMGFDLLTYKTVRNVERACHPWPNAMIIHPDHFLTASDIKQSITADTVEPEDLSQLSITNSYGMPSKAPDEWMDDVKQANSYLKDGQLMVVSVVGTPGNKGEGLNALAEDYAETAAKAVEAGAKAIEVNFSCPNVKGSEGGIFQSPEASGKIAEKTREAIGDNTKLLVKLGFYPDKAQADSVITAIAPNVDAAVAINTMPMKVYDKDGNQALPGEGRLVSGICGNTIRKAALETVKNIKQIIDARGLDLSLVGVGGIMSPDHALEYYDAGVDAIEMATSIMWNPFMALEIKKALAER
ncbi:MAG: dihydroorotate dehydrogenase [Candidatus Micrarchaeota archaeon]